MFQCLARAGIVFVGRGSGTKGEESPLFASDQWQAYTVVRPRPARLVRDSASTKKVSPNFVMVRQKDNITISYFG